MNHFQAIAFTESVKAVQGRMGSGGLYERSGPPVGAVDVIGPDQRAFLAERDSFYMATVGQGGWPYVQHRGGPKGFVRVLDEGTLGFADFRGNRQYISVGNIEHDDRVALIFVDYPGRARLKVFARARALGPGDHALLARLSDPAYGARVERGVVLSVEGLDWNCPQHIVPRWTEDEMMAKTAKLRERIEELEGKLASVTSK